jgi:iron complex outermembrane receptor protein
MKFKSSTHLGWLVGTALPMLALITTPSQAQSPQGSTALPAVVVDQPVRPAARARATRPSTARARATRQAAARNNAPVAAATAAAGIRAETATGPVQGYLANRGMGGTKTDTPLRETPQSISVVTADRITDQGGLSVQETLRYVPGVTADPFGGDARGDYTLIRGQEPSRYLDGMQGSRLSQVLEWRRDPYALERIEVLRGPSSVLYGGSSTGGVLNEVSKRPQAESRNEIGVQYGSFDRKQLQMDSTGKLTKDGEWLYRFVGVLRDSNSQVDYVPNDRILVAPSLTWRPTNDISWTVLGNYQKDSSSSFSAFLPIEGVLKPGPNGFIPVNRFAGEPNYDRYNITTGGVTSLYEQSFGDALKIKQSFRYSHTDGDYAIMYPDLYSNPTNPFLDAGRRTVQRIYYARQAAKDAFTSDSNAEIKLQTGAVSHKVLVGIDYLGLHEKTRSGSGLDPRPFDLYAPVYSSFSASLTDDPQAQQGQTGFYAQDQMRLGPWLALLGVRQDYVSYSVEGLPTQNDRATTGRAALMYELPFGVTPYVSWAQSFNPIFGAGTCATFCKPVRGEQYEVGVKYNPFAGTAINVGFYDTTEKNRLSGDPSNPIFSIQTGQVRIKGAELEVLTSVTPNLDLIGAYAYTDARIESGDNAGKRVASVPQQQASLWGKYRLASLGLPEVTVGAGVRYIGESWDGIDVLRTPDYTLFDAMVRWDSGPWRLQFNATNIADTRNIATCLSFGDCFYGMGRTLLSTATYRF